MKKTTQNVKDHAVLNLNKQLKNGVKIGAAIEAEAKRLGVSPSTVTAWHYKARNKKTKRKRTGEGVKSKALVKPKRKVDKVGKTKLVEPTIECPLCGHQIDKEEAKKAIRILLDFVSS